MRFVFALTISLAAACGGAAVEAPAPAATPASAPVVPAPSSGPAVEAVGLLPRGATAAGLIDLEAIRGTPWAERVLGALDRAGAGEWAALADVDLARDVERVIWFTMDREPAPFPIDVARAPTGGLVVELTPGEGRGACRPEALSAAQVEPVVAPAGEMDLVRCGSLVWLSCRTCALRPSPVSSSPTRSALEGLAARRASPRLALALVATREIYPVAHCDASLRIPLGPTHSMGIWLGDRLTFEGRITAEAPEELEPLERCAADGMADAATLLARLPGMTRVGIPAILARAAVSRDRTDAKTVVVGLDLDANEADLVMSALDLLAATLR